MNSKEHPLWERAHKLVLKIYRYTSTFPDSENLNLIRIVRTTIIQVCTEILKLPTKAESTKLTGIYNAPLGLVKKIRYYLFLSNDLGYGKTDELEKDLRVIETSLRAYGRKNERLNKGKY